MLFLWSFAVSAADARSDVVDVAAGATGLRAILWRGGAADAVEVRLDLGITSGAIERVGVDSISVVVDEMVDVGVIALAVEDVATAVAADATFAAGGGVAEVVATDTIFSAVEGAVVAVVADPISTAGEGVVDVVEADAIFAAGGGVAEGVAADAISLRVEGVVAAVAADAIFTAGGGTVGAVATDAISTAVEDAVAAVAADVSATAAGGAIAVDLSIPQLSTKQCMVPKVRQIPSRRSAYTERWAGGWKVYSKEPKQIGSLVLQTSVFRVDGAGATMIPVLVLSHRRRQLTRCGLGKSLGRVPRVD